MTGLTSQQQTEFAALRSALSQGDFEMVATSFEILQGLDVPVLSLLDTLGEGIWDDEDEASGIEGLIEQVLADMDHRAIPALATYLMEEEGPDLLLDMVAERLEQFSEKQLLTTMKHAMKSADERTREGVSDYLDEMAGDSLAAEELLDEFEDYD